MAKGIYVGASGGYKTGLIQGDIIPKTWTTVTTGTSYKASDGTKLTASGYTTGGAYDLTAEKACNGDMDTAWHGTKDSNPKWIQLEFSEAKKITKMKTCITFGNQYLTSCTIQGSKDNSTWKDLYHVTSSQVDSVNNSELRSITLSNTDYYKYYRIYVVLNTSTLTCAVYEWQVSEYEGTVYDSSTPNKAHKVKKAYMGVDSKARKIKKGYIGINGVARRFYSSDKELSYYGTTTDLSVARRDLAATTVGDYALFGGGYDGSAYSVIVDTYNKLLVKGTTTNLSLARQGIVATTVGDYALFGGGAIGGSQAAIDTYTSTLVKGTAADLRSGRTDLAATSVGNYALFGGGYNYTNKNTYTRAYVDAYTSALVKSIPSSLSVARDDLAATSVGNYALFGGGRYALGASGSTYQATVDTYTSTLVKGTAADLSIARRNLAATSVGNYALFGGGQYKSNDYVDCATVDTYTSTLVKGTAADLSAVRYELAATTFGDYALFGGGHDNSMGVGVKAVDTYTSALVKGTATNLAQARYRLAATIVGDYALFGGGDYSGSSYKATVDVYQYN